MRNNGRGSHEANSQSNWINISRFFSYLFVCIFEITRQKIMLYMECLSKTFKRICSNNIISTVERHVLVLSNWMKIYIDKPKNWHIAEQMEKIFRHPKNIVSISMKKIRAIRSIQLVSSVHWFSIVDFFSSTFLATNIVQSWYNYGKQYNINDPSSAAPFTQLVWKQSTEMGIGHAYNGQKLYILALYQPPGNIPNEYAANVGCPSNR